MALSRAVQWRLSNFSTKQISIAACAFAAAGHTETQLFTALAGAAEMHVLSSNVVNAVHLSGTAYAFAAVGNSDAQLFPVFARILEQHVDEFDFNQLTHTA